MSDSSHTRSLHYPPPGGASRHLRLTQAHLLGRIGDLVEVERIVQDVVAYRYVRTGRHGVCPLRELLDAAEEVEA